jgi:hypothetical protein
LHKITAKNLDGGMISNASNKDILAYQGIGRESAGIGKFIFLSG